MRGTNMDQKVSEAKQQPASKQRRMLGSGNQIELAPNTAFTDTIFGLGMNCITGSVVNQNRCVKDIAILTPQNTKDDDLQVTVIQDSQSYSSFLSTAVNATASGLSWSGSAAVSYAESQTGSDTYMSYVAFRVLRSQTIYMDITKATIDKAALALITSDPSNGPARFIATYGTHCAIGVAYGGSFVGRLRLETSSASSKESVAASMSASAGAFGVSGSINAQFNSELSKISTHYYLSSDSDIKGATTSQFERHDPDGMVAAAENIQLIPDTHRNVEGNAIAFICMTWDQFPEIQAALASINQPHAFSFTTAAGNIAQLSIEYSALEYVMGTCTNMIKSGSYAIPSYGATLGRMLNAAGAGQMAIQSLTIEQIGQLTQQELARYLISAQMKPLLNAISHNQVLVSASWYLDAAFKTPGSFSGTYASALTNDWFRVAEVEHNGFSEPAALYFQVGQNGPGKYLIARWDWENQGHFDGASVDIGTSSFPTGVSKATWAGADWNNISAQLIDFNPAALYGRS